jgi:SM-20-related protein
MNSSPQHDRICHDLVSQGWTVIDGYFEPELIKLLADECHRQQQLGLLQAARIGRLEQNRAAESIRGDQIRWLESGMAPCIDQFLAQIEALRSLFNRRLYLGLEECENHFAYYPAGAFYRKHLDRFQNSDSRVISSVLYLNPDWSSEHGGELRLHLEEDRYEDIEPVANRLVLFISAQILHEVLPTTVERMSLTGWFRRHGIESSV